MGGETCKSMIIKILLQLLKVTMCVPEKYKGTGAIVEQVDV